jgi:hypothetical protein
MLCYYLMDRATEDELMAHLTKLQARSREVMALPFLNVLRLSKSKRNLARE